MKSKKWMLAVLVAALAASVGNAQTSDHAALTVRVPFEFVVGNQTFPAGAYKFRSLLNSDPTKATVEVLEVRSTEGRRYQAIVTEAVGSDAPTNPRLIFTRSDGRTFLSEVWEPGKSSGCRLRSHKDVQTAGSEGDQVTLVAAADWR